MTTLLRRRALTALTAVSLASVALAQTCPSEPPLSNTAGGSQMACPCFAVGERAAAIFEAPPEHYPIEIEKVRITWGSIFGGGPTVLEQAIEIYPAGLPNPGIPIFSIGGPQLVDGFVNEFDLSILPGNKTINSGEFTVALQFANANAGQIFDPSVVSIAPCTPGDSAIFAIPGGWQDACSAGVTGNWAFEVDYRIANCEALNRDVSTVSLSSGGTQRFTLAAGSGAAGWFYWIFGSVTGTAPGIDFGGGVVLPLNFDPYFNLTLTKPALGIFGSYIGFLNALDGTGFASFSIPAGADPGLAGLTLNHAYLSGANLGDTDFASNAKSVTLTM